MIRRNPGTSARATSTTPIAASNGTAVIRPHITVRGPGRCEGCSFHVATQGHRPGCDGTAPVTPELDPEWEAMGFLGRVAHTQGKAAAL
jgi:hypothetical protein